MLKTKLPLSLPLLALPIFLAIASAVLVDKSTNAQVLCQIKPTSVVSSVEQAKCLLREPQIWGNVGSELTSLPSPLDQLLSLPTIDVTKQQLRTYLATHKIQEKDIGGSLDEPVSRTNNNAPNAELARYLIIHDTSTPNYGNNRFPADINQASWAFNNLNNYGSGEKSPAHIIINRLGQSVTRKNFNTPWRSTQRESNDNCGVNQCKGLFLGVELVQPRHSSPNGPSGNDAIAPDPGFTTVQLNRLALVYIAASVRRGKWLIPVFHVALDKGVGDHDDPQHFNLNQWATQLNTLLSEIRS